MPVSQKMQAKGKTRPAVVQQYKPQKIDESPSHRENTAANACDKPGTGNRTSKPKPKAPVLEPLLGMEASQPGQVLVDTSADSCSLGTWGYWGTAWVVSASVGFKFWEPAL